MKRRLAPLGILVAAVALASCTYVPTQSSPQSVASHDVPFGLLSKVRPKPPAGLHLTNIHHTIYLINARGQLVPETRTVALPGRLVDVLRTLLDGVSDQERNRGVTTDLPGSLRVVGATDIGGILYIDFSGALLVHRSKINAVAQIVLTASAMDGNAMELRFNGRPIALPRPGQSPAFVVSAYSYASLLAR